MKIENLSIKPDIKWFEQLPKSEKVKSDVKPDIEIALKAEAQNLLESEAKQYQKLKENRHDKDFLWIKKILQAGTLSDKVSAHTLLIQDSPVYSLSSLETLVGMVNTKGKRECLMAMDTLQELFAAVLLADDRKLKLFSEQPLEHLSELSKGAPILRKRYLMLWEFEDQLKILYKKFLTNLENVSHDTIEKTKVKAITVMARLLTENCEEEQYLLERLVNKMGDPVAKVGSHVCHQLGSILHHHGDMKTVIVQEVERLIFRPNLAERAKYYALCFLNQIILSHDEFQLANHLIMIYFGQFKLFVRKGEVNTKMMSALLTGVARAYPYAKLKDNVIIEQLDAMYRLVHMVSFNISVQALMLIFQVLDSGDSISDRFYSVLYRKLFDPELATSSRQASVLNLVYRALKKDVAVVRIKAFVKRLLQVALYQAPSLQSGILILISELNKLHPTLLEVKKSFESDSESEEHYEDAPDEDENEDSKPETKTETETEDIKPKVKPSWVHKPHVRKAKTNSKSAYDFDCRNPLSANAESQQMWELLHLKNCFHPSVSLFAHQVANSNPIKYSGDPLLDFTTARFLDRFVYRNPKKPSDGFQTNPKTKVFAKRKLKESLHPKKEVLSNEYLQQREDRVPIEERFIYKYLQNRASQKGKSTKEDSDIESICSEDFEKLLDEIHPEDEGKDSLNFYKELGMHKLKNKAANKRAASDSEEDEVDDGADDSELEDEIDFGGEDFEDIDDLDVCEEDFVGGMEDDEDEPRHKSKKSKRIGSLMDDNLLADADEFSTLLEESGGSGMVTSEAVSNKDKSSAKQMKWEQERHGSIKRSQSKKKFGGRKNWKGQPRKKQRV
ncbi:hypothetical protein JTE90_025014 [Oedothorax gibbosus]|uniref:CCAAT/enhancer-binding protein zeta n=1 Tax=Oedothorax gibbosus TaxID=931172 RepID=A0AAV6VWV6_9ARAC|nr:hypothetical protein JTE90_025014 [Oedothorax gibbosus]